MDFRLSSQSSWGRGFSRFADMLRHCVMRLYCCSCLVCVILCVFLVLCGHYIKPSDRYTVVDCGKMIKKNTNWISSKNYAIAYFRCQISIQRGQIIKIRLFSFKNKTNSLNLFISVISVWFNTQNMVHKMSVLLLDARNIRYQVGEQISLLYIRVSVHR